AGSTVASVSTIESIVAIRGWIIPTPFAIPVTRTARTVCPSRSGSVIVVVATFVTESVVRSASAAAVSPASVGLRVGVIAAIPAPTRSSGRRVPMIPVERRSVCSDVVSRAAARSSAISAWSASPAAPVAALAEPLVALTPVPQPYRPWLPDSVAARCACDRRTGAAAKAFGVKTAAAAALGRTPSWPGCVATIARSGRPDALMPATPAPATNPSGIAARRSTGGNAVGRAARDVVAIVIGGSGRQRELLETRGLGQGVDEVEGLDRLPRGAFHEVVDHADREDPAGSRVVVDRDADVVAAQDMLGRR